MVALSSHLFSESMASLMDAIHPSVYVYRDRISLLLGNTEAEKDVFFHDLW